MPADDLVLNVRQINNYPPAGAGQLADALLIQRGGLGGPYLSISAGSLIGNALASSGEMTIGGPITAFSFEGGNIRVSNGVINTLASSNAAITSLNIAAGYLNGEPLATQCFVANSTVASFNFRRGDVVLDIADITAAGGVAAYSGHFEGCPTAPTAALDSNSDQLATTAFVQQGIAAYVNYLLQTQPFVFSFNGRSGNVVLTEADVTAAGGLSADSPAFTGTPTAPTPAPGTYNTQIATTEFVVDAINAALNSGLFAPINSPTFTGFPAAPTAPAGTHSGQLATTAFVANAVAESTTGVASFNGRTGIVTLTSTDITNAGGSSLASPAFTGTPTAPTATPGTSTTQLATTAFVMAAVAAAGGVASFNGRTGVVVLTAPDISALGFAATASPTFTGVPLAPTAAPGTNTQQLATTAYVEAAVAAGVAGVASFNGRTGIVTLTSGDISAAGGAPAVSPVFTGTPEAPTAAPGTNTTQLATTAFVEAAVGTASGVASFNGRTGAVTLTSADLTAAGGVSANSPAFTGAPTAPTATPGTSTTQLATTAFVMAAIAGIVVPVASTTTPIMDGVAAVGVGTTWARADHVHPSDTSRLSSAVGGTVSGPVDLKVQTVAQSGAALSINRSLGENCTLSVTAAITSIAVTNWPASGFTGKVRLVIVNTGAFAMSGWPAGTKWPGGAGAPTITPSGTDIIILMTDNGGTTVYGSVVGQAYA